MTLPDFTPIAPFDAGAVLPGEVPVEMPDLPPYRDITTVEQYKAFSEPVRRRILGIIQTSPATAKQIADRLGIAPGTAGHHLQVLEATGLAQVVARRLVRGIVAKYYTRTARVFTFKVPPDVVGERPLGVGMLHDAGNELAEAIATFGETAADCAGGFPHIRMKPDRLEAYKARINALVDDFLHEPHDPDGQVYGLAVSLFLAPPYFQGDQPSPATPPTSALSPASQEQAEEKQAP